MLPEEAPQHGRRPDLQPPACPLSPLKVAGILVEAIYSCRLE